MTRYYLFCVRGTRFCLSSAYVNEQARARERGRQTERERERGGGTVAHLANQVINLSMVTLDASRSFLKIGCQTMWDCGKIKILV